MPSFLGFPKVPHHIQKRKVKEKLPEFKGLLHKDCLIVWAKETRMTKSQNYRLCKVGRDHRGFICSRMCNVFAHPYTGRRGVRNARQNERQDESLKGAQKNREIPRNIPELALEWGSIRAKADL